MEDHTREHQTKQKTEYDKWSKESKFSVGDRVMTYMPGTVQGKLS